MSPRTGPSSTMPPKVAGTPARKPPPSHSPRTRPLNQLQPLNSGESSDQHHNPTRQRGTAHPLVPPNSGESGYSKAAHHGLLQSHSPQLAPEGPTSIARGGSPETAHGNRHVAPDGAVVDHAAKSGWHHPAIGQQGTTHRPRIRQNSDANHFAHLNSGEPSDIMHQVGKVLPGLKFFDDLL
ncbi:hypothetical protein RISK_001410 [Rhodopirellula islandica]|uniref:Uncharacterized protein n=1 Tax=Rhodopirellula islandica TaxID=595434 RepID=A0A0J1BJC8_RHOIS|nr:hypothetical protein RISK_001410 [Rhodopirellula islandica]